MGQNIYWETDIHSASQAISHNLCNMKVHCHADNNPPMVPILNLRDLPKNIIKGNEQPKIMQWEKTTVAWNILVINYINKTLQQFFVTCINYFSPKIWIPQFKEKRSMVPNTYTEICYTVWQFWVISKRNISAMLYTIMIQLYLKHISINQCPRGRTKKKPTPEFYLITS
jgi:hypothetical protein